MSTKALFDIPHQKVMDWVKDIVDGILNLKQIREVILPYSDALDFRTGYAEEDYAEVWEHVLNADRNIGSEDLRFGAVYTYDLNLAGKMIWEDGQGILRVPRYSLHPTYDNASPETNRKDEGVLFVNLNDNHMYAVLDGADRELVNTSQEATHTADVIFGSGRPWYDVRAWDHLVVGGDWLPAFNAAIAAAADDDLGYGGVVYVPKGEYAVSDSITLLNRVRLVGECPFGSIIKADSSLSFPTDTPLIILGNAICFHVRVENLRLDCDDISGSIGVYTEYANEDSGVFRCQVDSYRGWGIYYDSGSSIIGVRDCLIFPSASYDSLGGIKFDSVAGQNYIQGITISESANTHGDGIYVNATNVRIESVHVERHTDGIHFAGGSNGVITGVYGHSSVTNLVHLDSGVSLVTLQDIQANSATNILLDEHKSNTYASGDVGYITLYLGILIKGDTYFGDQVGVGIAPEHLFHVFSASDAKSVVESDDTADDPCVATRAIAGGVYKQIMYWNKDYDMIFGRADDAAGANTQLDMFIDTSGIVQIPNELKVDLINEYTLGAGVIIDGVKYLDGEIYVYDANGDYVKIGIPVPLGANFDLDIPQITANSTFAVLDLTQTFTANQTISHASAPYLLVEDTSAPCQTRLHALDTRGQVGTVTNHDFRLMSNAIERVVLTAAGNLGVGPVAITPSYTLSIGSTDGSKQIGMYHDNSNAYMKWTDGALFVITDEGTNTNTELKVQGKGTGRGYVRIYDEDNGEVIDLFCQSGEGFIRTGGGSAGDLELQDTAHADVNMFSGAASGETPSLQVSGYKTGNPSGKITASFGVSSSDNETFLLSGPDNWKISGNLEVTGVLNASAVPMRIHVCPDGSFYDGGSFVTGEFWYDASRNYLMVYDGTDVNYWNFDGQNP